MPKDCLPELISRIGYSGQPTAVVLTQCPDELGMCGYPRDCVSCTLVVATEHGAKEYVQAKRWLVQLGVGSPVQRQVEGDEITVGIHMSKMVCKLSPLHGWASGQHPSSVLIAQLTARIPEAAVDSIIARDDATFTFLCA